MLINDSQEKISNIDSELRLLRNQELEEEEFMKSGGFGRFQKFANLIIIMGILSGSQILYNLWYFQMMPIFECKTANSLDHYHQCSRESFCNNPQIDWRIDYSKEESLNNWVQQLNLFCITQTQQGLIGSFFFLGAFLGCFFIPRLADIYGRKKPYIFGLILYSITAIIYPFSTSLNLNYLLIFLGGISESGRYYVGFVYLQELMPKSHQTLVGLNIFLAHAFAKLFYDFYFYQITKNWIYLSYSSIAMVLICLICMYWIPESPKFLISSNQKQRAKQSFDQIAQINGVRNTFEEQLQTQMIHHFNEERKDGQNKADAEDTSRSQSQDIQIVEKFDQLFKKKRYLLNLLIMIFSWSTASFGFYLIPYFLSSINSKLQQNSFNVFQLGMASSVSEIFANVFCYFITGLFPNKKSLIYSYILAFLGSVGFWAAQDSVFNSSNILYYLLFSKFGITVAFNITYVIMGELFPTLLKATAFGICNIIARMITILSPMIALLDQPYPMLIFCNTCLIAGLLSIFLKPIIK
eukprot:403371019